MPQNSRKFVFCFKPDGCGFTFLPAVSPELIHEPDSPAITAVPVSPKSPDSSDNLPVA
jgi:hypothetical protein